MRRGFTMIEVLLAVGLLSILVVALVRLLDTSLKIWGRTETNRELLETGGAVLDLMADDLYALDGGPRGDLLGEWVRFDTDRDGTRGALHARLRLVRQATAADLLRLEPDEAFDPRARDLVEVCWALLPMQNAEPDERSVGVLWRGERRVGDADTVSFLDERFFDSVNKPAPGSLNVVTGGVLWFELWYAAQTSVLHDGWELGESLADCAAAWDAWNRQRPDEELTFLNTPAAGMPKAKDVPLLPRRVRILVEIEPPSELRWRTRLTADVEPDVYQIEVRDEQKLPPAGGMILIDEEWMEVLSVGRGRASVRRGQRGTRPATHAPGAMIHHGARAVRDVSIAMTREDWDL